MPPDGTATIAQSPEELRAKWRRRSSMRGRAFFKLEAQLPQQGCTDTPAAASGKTWVVLKIGAAASKGSTVMAGSTPTAAKCGATRPRTKRSG